MNKRQMRQGGSALVYALVAGVLVVVLVGGLYFLRQYKEAPQEVAANDSSNTSKTEKKSDNTEKSTSGESKKSDTSSSKTDTDKSKKSESPAVGHSHKETTTLPATGSESGVMQLFALTVLTFAGVSYYTSRHPRWTSRDK